jgi:GH24 family phage-related lysozyme (muramidase)
MVAKFLGAKIAGDDEYFQYVIKHGPSVDHNAQTQALMDIGIKSTWNTNLDLDDLDKSLNNGLPIVIGILHHGSLEQPSGGGHIIVVVGRNANGDYIVNDPYGDLISEYNDDNGKNVVYSRHVLTCRWTVEGKGSGWGRLFYGNNTPAAPSGIPAFSFQNGKQKPPAAQPPAAQNGQTGQTANGIPLCGIELIKTFEGYAEKLPDGRARAYPDPITGWQLPTIGYGNTTYPNGQPVKQGDIITHAQAEEYLAWEIAHKCKPNLEKIPNWSKMNDNQRGALYSFAYNLGAGFYGDADFGSITRVCDSADKWKDLAWVEEQFVKYRNPGTPAEVGLRRRRSTEAKLFCS